MKFPKSQLIPLVMKLGNYLKSGFDHAVAMKAAGSEIDADIVAIFLLHQMETWNPTISGKELLDEETKGAAARFVAGVAFNISK
jgi:hypothetical protein